MMNLKVKIQLEYNQQTVTIDTEAYRPISYLREKACSVFYPLNFENKYLSFKNKDLTSSESLMIGDYFKSKTHIVIKILTKNNKPQKESKPKINLQNDYMPEDEYLKTVKVNVATETERENMEEHVKFSMICDCKSTQIGYYCRKCSYYICKPCRVKSTHLNHKVVSVDLTKDSASLENSIKMYCMNIMADSSLCFNAMKGYKKLFEEKNITDLSKKKEELHNKLQEFEDKISLMMNSLPILDKVNTGADAFAEYEHLTNSMCDEVNKIVNAIDQSKKGSPVPNEYYIGQQTLTLDKSKEIFEKMSSYDDNIEKLSQKVLAYKVNYDVCNSIKDMYDNLIKSINDIIKKDYSFSINFTAEESKLFSSEISSILRQTANVRNNDASNSISNLYNINNRYKHLNEEDQKKRKNKHTNDFDNLQNEDYSSPTKNKNKENDSVLNPSTFDNNEKYEDKEPQEIENQDS